MILLNDPSIPEVICKQLLAIMEHINVYKDFDINLSYETVPLHDCKLLVNSVSRKRLDRAQELVRWQLANHGTPFQPCIRELMVADYRLVIPPIIEYSNGYFVMDGSHRMFAGHEMLLGEINALVVTAPKLPPKCFC